MASLLCCVPISKFNEIKRLRDEALEQIENIKKELDEIKETAEEYKEKYETAMKQVEGLKDMKPDVGDVSGDVPGDVSSKLPF